MCQGKHAIQLQMCHSAERHVSGRFSKIAGEIHQLVSACPNIQPSFLASLITVGAAPCKLQVFHRMEVVRHGTPSEITGEGGKGCA